MTLLYIILGISISTFGYYFLYPYLKLKWNAFYIWAMIKNLKHRTKRSKLMDDPELGPEFKRLMGENLELLEKFSEFLSKAGDEIMEEKEKKQ